jgi:hypothetical protein
LPLLLQLIKYVPPLSTCLLSSPRINIYPKFPSQTCIFLYSLIIAGSFKCQVSDLCSMLEFSFSGDFCLLTVCPVFSFPWTLCRLSPVVYIQYLEMMRRIIAACW